MSPDDKVKAFKEETRNYQRYLDHIKGIDDKLEVLRSRMENVHSIDFEKERTQVSFRERPIIDMIERKAMLEKEKQLYQDLINWIHKVIDAFGSPSIKAIVWMTYVQRRSLTSISEEYLISKDNLYKIRRKHLNRVLSDDLMSELDEIHQSLDMMNGAM